MIHHRQRLPFRLEAGDDLLAIQAGLDDLESDPAANRLLLLGHVDNAHAAFADFLEQLVRADDGARTFGGERAGRGEGEGRRRSIQNAARGLMRRQQGFDAYTQGGVSAAGAVQVGRAFGGGRFFQGGGEEGLFAIGGRHGGAPETVLPPPCAFCRGIVPRKIETSALSQLNSRVAAFARTRVPRTLASAATRNLSVDAALVAEPDGSNRPILDDEAWNLSEIAQVARQ